VPGRRRIDPVDGRRALQVCRAAGFAAGRAARADLGTAVRFALEELTVRAPGRTVEVRVPPFGATQCIQGPAHSRGTPPNVIETDPATWLALATGILTWSAAVERGAVSASGQRAHLDGLLPLFGTGD